MCRAEYMDKKVMSRWRCPGIGANLWETGRMRDKEVNIREWEYIAKAGVMIAVITLVHPRRKPSAEPFHIVRFEK
jgi:hypothetical protein